MTDAILAAFAGVLDHDTACEVIDYRKRMGKRYALTERSAIMLAKNLARFSDPIAAAEEMVVRGWQSIKPEWCPELAKGPVIHLSAEFEQLWRAYPIQDAENYAGALAAFNEAAPADWPLILQAAQWLKGSLPASYDPTYAEKRRFIPSLRVWLSERRYESKRQAFEAYRRQQEQKKA